MSKKINSLKEEGKKLKYKRKFEDSIEKFKQGIDKIRMKIKDREEKEELIKEFEDEIDLVYCAEIENKAEESEELIKKNQYSEAIEALNNAMAISNKIKDTETRSSQSKNIEKLLKETEIKQLIFQGKKLKEEGNPDESLKFLDKALKMAKDIYDAEAKGAQFISIQNAIDDSYSSKIVQITNKGKELKQNGQLEEALRTYDEALSIIEKMHLIQNKEREEAKIKTIKNEAYADQIKPMIETGKKLVSEQSFENAVKELNIAASIAEKMYDSELKRKQLKEISEFVNPVYIKQIEPILENAIKITKQDNFEETISLVNQAAETFQNALRFAEKMIKSEEKDAQINKITQLVNQTCSSGIKVRKEKGLQHIDDKKFDDAIGELYSALSIAKNMAFAEDENEEIDDIKRIVNKVYIAQIKDVVEQGKAQVNQKNYDEALKIFKEAIGITNKMYVGGETENQIRKIKRLIKDAEVKKTVAEGGVLEEKSKFADEMQELIGELDKATELTDPEYKEKKIKEIKDSMDQVRSKEIKFILEQAIQLMEQEKHDDADIQLGKALEIAEQIETWMLRNEEYSNMIKANLEITNILINQNEHDEAFDIFENSLKIGEKIEEKELRKDQLFNTKELFKDALNKKASQDLESGAYEKTIEYGSRAVELDDSFLEPYYLMGNAYRAKKEYDNAIAMYNKVVELDSSHMNAWNNMGLAYESKGDLDRALEAFNKTITLDANFAEGWYNIANIYKRKNEEDKAIENYTKASTINENFANAWLFKGSIYLNKRDYDMALELIDKATRIESNIAAELKNPLNEIRKTLDSIQEKISDMFKNK